MKSEFLNYSKKQKNLIQMWNNKKGSAKHELNITKHNINHTPLKIIIIRWGKGMQQFLKRQKTFDILTLTHMKQVQCLLNIVNGYFIIFFFFFIKIFSFCFVICRCTYCINVQTILKHSEKYRPTYPASFRLFCYANTNFKF